MLCYFDNFMYICNVNFFNVKPSILKIMEKEKHELEVVHGIEKVNSNTLSHVKGGISDLAEEKCCDIQFSCNNKGGKCKRDFLIKYQCIQALLEFMMRIKHI